MHQPEGIIILEKKDRVCLMKKSLYVLKHSLRQWYKRYDTFIISNGYHRSGYDNYVYHKELFDGYFIIYCYMLMTCLIACKNMFEINKLKTQLQVEFEMKTLELRRKC